jgi:NB-ARC domain
MQLITYSQGIQTSVDELSDRFDKFFRATFETHARFVEFNLPPQSDHLKPPSPPKTLFRVPFERTPQFQGRSDVLDSLQEQLSRSAKGRYNHRLAIHGLGGIGKTQLAIEYAYRQRDAGTYDYIVWLNAAEHSGLIQGLAAVGWETDGTIRKDESQLTLAAEDAVKWLGRQPKCLVVYDNLDDVHIVRGLLPSHGSGCHHLITTRNADVIQIPSEGLEINELNDSEALEFLRRASNRTADDDEVIHELGRFPLAIEHAAVFIRDWDCKTFLECFRHSATDFIRETPEGNQAYPMSLYATWTLSLERLSQSSIAFAELFDFLQIPMK